ISLKLALPPALGLAGGDARALLLVKPQFEAGREAIGKGGLLKSPGDAERIAVDLRDWLAGIPGWRVLGLIPSPIEGGDGNREFLLAAIKDAAPR
ncbi:TlyA family rRNA (cytidine-2'-O)-methyltransferase, partial [Streptococcus pyogenes]